MPVTIKGKDGAQYEVELSTNLYKEAVEENKTVPQLINSKFETDPALYGTAYEQLCASTGLLMGKEHVYGLKPPTIGDVLSGKAMLNATSVADANPASRILFPAAVLEMVENQLATNRTADPSEFDKMVALDTSVTNPRIEQPILNLSKAEGARSKAISQLAEPARMLTITTSDVSRTLPTLSLGLEVSDQALQATTLDFVSMAVNRQAEVERNARVYDYLLAMLNGDTDNNQSALSQTKANVFDTSIVAAGNVTKTALVKWLVTNYYKRRLDWIVTDVNGLLAIEAAFQTTNTGNYPLPGLVPQFSIANRVLSKLNVFVTDPAVATWPANTLMGLDSRAAIHRIRNSAAAYSAVDSFVLRRSSALRFDFSEIAIRMFDDAFDTLSLTVA